MSNANRTKKILLGVGGGCLGLVVLCCGSGAGLVLYRSRTLESNATDQVERFLGHVQARDWQGAFADSEYDLAYSFTSHEAHQSCVEDTAIGDLTGFRCESAELTELTDDHVEVTCTVTSASRGETAVTIGVNSADSRPYLGFYWFSSPSAFGSRWSSDACTTWSGREYFRAPPPGRVRPR